MSDATFVRRSWPMLALLLAAMGALTLARMRFGEGAGVTPVAERGGVRELVFPLLDGGQWRSREHNGAVVAVNFWATWCEPCREEIPAFNRLVEKFGPQRFAVVGVSLDTGADKVEVVTRFRADYRVMYAMAFPEPMSQIAAGLDGVPTTMLLDRQGRAAKVYVGEVRERTLRADVAALLSERP